MAPTHWRTKPNATEIALGLAGYRANRPGLEEAFSLYPAVRSIRWLATID